MFPSLTSSEVCRGQETKVGAQRAVFSLSLMYFIGLVVHGLFLCFLLCGGCLLKELSILLNNAWLFLPFILSGTPPPGP